MNNTALGAENKKEQTINFISEAHEKFYYEKLKEVRYQDVYHKALCYCLGISDDKSRNVDRIYDFKTGCVKTECLHEGWQTSGSMKAVSYTHLDVYKRQLYVSRKRGKSILLFFILLILSTFVLTGLSIGSASKQAQKNLRCV